MQGHRPGGDSWHYEAVQAEDEAIDIASRLGLVVSGHVTLSDSNSVVVWLRPSPVVAKVAVGHRRRLALEMSVAKHLASRGAPVVGPATQVPQEVHRGERFEVTFWAYQAHSADEPAGRPLTGALGDLHRALAGYGGALPSYQDELSAVAELLSDGTSAPALAGRDRSLLLPPSGASRPSWRAARPRSAPCTVLPTALMPL